MRCGKYFALIACFFLQTDARHVRPHKSSKNLEKHAKPSSVNVLLGDATVLPNAGVPVSANHVLPVSAPKKPSSEALSVAVQQAINRSNALKQQEQLANEEDVAREAQERDSLRNLRVAEAEEAKNEAVARELRDKHELQEKKEEFRHELEEAATRRRELEEAERERLDALSDEEAELEQEDMALHAADKEARKTAAILKENVEEEIEHRKEKENHDIKNAIAAQKEKALQFTQIQKSPTSGLRLRKFALAAHI